MQIEPKEIHYTYNTKGYMIFYRGRPIGGVGIENGAKGCRSNLKLNKEQAEMTKQRIIKGFIPQYMMTAILKIQEATANEE